VPYGDDITEGIPYTLSNPAGATNYSSTGEAYDIAIAGLPFFLFNSDDAPYRRVTAQYRKQQIDQSREPGEQTLTGWWLRSQSSFHYGQGIKFFEPIQDESLRFQYTESKGIDVWTKGQATLLKDVDGGIHTTTGGLQASGRPNQMLRSIKWTKPTFTGATTSNTYNGVLMLDEYDVDKILPRITVSITNKARTTTTVTLTTSAAHGLAVGMQIIISGVGSPLDGEFRITSVPTATTFTYTTVSSGTIASTVVSPPGTGISDVTHFIDYNTGTDDPVFAICDDGTYAYWVTNQTAGGAKKIHVYKKLLSDDSTVSPTLMFNATGIVVTNAVMEFTKERLVMAANNKVYEFATTATSLPTAVYTHPTDNFVYTSITSSGAAIYLAGYTNIQSTIQKFTLTTAGAMPTLTSAITAAELPVGEIVFKIAYYLGNMAIGTNQGMRMADASQLDGSVTYGALIFESDQPVYDFAFRDRYIWAASSVEGQVGVTRVDMGQPLGNLLFPYAWDLYDPNDVLGHYTTACAFLGDTNRLAFCNAGNGANGYVYIESATELIPQGTLRTGYVRYNTLELKIFKLMQARVDTANGGLLIDSIDYADNFYRIGTFTQEANVPEVNINYPQASQEYLGFQFTLTRSTTDVTKGPLFTGYQIKALPAIPRQRLIQYPLSCFDHESDHFGVEVGYEGSAYFRMSQLESIENVGDTIRVEDFRTGESYIGLIEELDFRNATPSDKRFTGYGGTLLVTIRTV
jgi:hypothetical protein